MRTGLVNALVESGIGSLKRVAGHGADYIGGITSILPAKSIACRSQHSLSAVDQRDGLLGLQHERLDLAPLERVRARNPSAFVVEAFAFANQRKRQMRQRSEIADWRPRFPARAQTE